MEIYNFFILVVFWLVTMVKFQNFVLGLFSYKFHFNIFFYRFATIYKVSLLKNMANESKTFHSLFKIAYY
jgi:hypothetical protein